MEEILPTIRSYILNEQVYLPLPRGDIQRLRFWKGGEEAHISGDIINAYLGLVCKRNEANEGLPKAFPMSTYFLDIKAEGVIFREYPPKKVDIFNYDILLVPLYIRKYKQIGHWTIAIIQLTKTHIEYYDSLSGRTNPLISNALYEYLKMEWFKKSNTLLDLSHWTSAYIDTPKQDNLYDCGLFICMYANFVCLNHGTINISQQQMKYYRQQITYEICKNKIENESEAIEPITNKRPRGRPKKPYTEKIEETVEKRPRGRPRKRPEISEPSVHQTPKNKHQKWPICNLYNNRNC